MKLGLFLGTCENNIKKIYLLSDWDESLIYFIGSPAFLAKHMDDPRWADSRVLGWKLEDDVLTIKIDSYIKSDNIQVNGTLIETEKE